MQNNDRKNFEDALERITNAIDIAIQYGGFDGAHHKDWVIDQMVRKLAGSKYDEIVADAIRDEEGNIVYSWECGVAP